MDRMMRILDRGMRRGITIRHPLQVWNILTYQFPAEIEVWTESPYADIFSKQQTAILALYPDKPQSMFPSPAARDSRLHPQSAHVMR